MCTLLCIIDGRWQTLANVHLLVWHAFPLALPWLQRTPTQEGEKAGSADGEDLVPCQSIRCADGECILFWCAFAVLARGCRVHGLLGKGASLDLFMQAHAPGRDFDAGQDSMHMRGLAENLLPAACSALACI